MAAQEAQHLNMLEEENKRLMKLMAELRVDNRILSTPGNAWQ
jgi:hypothetical protein